jgi:hypothetical protein
MIFWNLCMRAVGRAVVGVQIFPVVRRRPKAVETLPALNDTRRRPRGRRDVSAAEMPAPCSPPAGGIADVSVGGPEIAAKWLAHPRADFADAAAYVLKKNAELYRRLA